MRPLTNFEIEAVSGAETIQYQLPAGVTVTTKLENNQSTTLTISNFPHTGTISWNSGTALACSIITGGFSVTAAFISRSGTIGALTGELVGFGCSYLIMDSPPPPTDDGDA